jgi:hypothetical protein
MSYIEQNSDIHDYNYIRYCGWGEDNKCIIKLFSPETVRMISKKVTELTIGVDYKNRKIIVPDERIYEVLDGTFRAYRPPTGDIYSRYIIPNDNQANMVQSIIDQTIEVITSNIRNQLGMEEQNQKLSAWVQLYGDFSEHQLRQHAPIKILEKRPATMQFNMNY